MYRHLWSAVSCAVIAACTVSALAAAATGCTAGTKGTPAPEPAPAEFVQLNLTIDNGTVTPNNAELHATAGQPVVVQARTDEYDDLVIGSDPEVRFGIDPRADGPQVLQFTVDAPGTVTAKLLRQSGCPHRCTYTHEQDTASPPPTAPVRPWCTPPARCARPRC